MTTVPLPTPRLLTAVIAVLLVGNGVVLAGRGGDTPVRTGPRAAGVDVAGAAVPFPSTTTPSVANPAPSSGSARTRPSGGGTALATTATSKPPGAAEAPELPMELTLSAACVEQGGVIKAFITTKRSAYVAAAAGDSAGQQVGSPYTGPVGADGKLTYVVNVPLTAALGEAGVTVVGVVPNETQEHTTKQAGFRIAAPRGC